MRPGRSLALLFAVSAIAGAPVAHALEPSPPQSLISAEEAVIISIRQRLDREAKSGNKQAQAERRSLSQFYATGTTKPVWVDANGLTPQALKVIAEIRNAAAWGLDPAAFELPELPTGAAAKLSPLELIDVELKVSLAAVKYARHASGGRYDPRDLSEAIDREPELPAARQVIAALLAASDPAATLVSFHPQHEQFKLLRTAYLKALEDERNPDAAATESETDRKGRKSKKKRKQKTKLSSRLLYNMEMWRWMPRELGTKHIIANVPEFQFRLVEGNRIIHSERIITGKVKNKTPIFSDEMETVVLNPKWNVPNSIKVKELLPGLLQGRDVLGRQGLRVRYGREYVDPYSVDWSRADIRNFHIYQPPGGGNALGRVKFLFPNRHAVYMHDTPTKHLFKKDVRAFSHGCVRVRDPLKFAELLLAADKGWTRSDIDRVLRNRDSDDENPVKLDKKIPVHITYFTAHVGSDGKIALYNDIYSLERLIQMGIDGKAHLIVKPKENLGEDLSRIVGRRNNSERVSSNYGGGSSGGRPPRWVREMWGWD